MIFRNTEKRSSARALFGFVAVTTVALLSSVMVAVPAQATTQTLTVVPSKPALKIGSPSPQLTLTSNTRTLGTPTQYLYVIIKTGGNLWEASSTCPIESAATTTLSNCGITNLVITARDENPVTMPTSITAFQDSRGVGLKFSPALDADLQGVIGLRDRSFAVELAPGAFTVTGYDGVRTEGPINFTLDMFSTPAAGNGGVNAQGSGYSTPNYQKYSFDSRGGTGTMSDALIAPDIAIPANIFSKPGFNFAGWATTQNGAANGFVSYTDQEIYSSSGFIFPTFFAVWNAVGSNTPPSGSSTAPASTTPATTAPATATPAARLATTGSNLSAWAPGLALGLGWMLVAYSRSLRASRARHLKI